MAKGYPDFFGQSIFPHYGAAARIDGADVLGGVDDSDLILLDMKGSVIGGYFLFSNPTAGYENAYLFRVYVDGELVTQFSMGALANVEYICSVGRLIGTGSYDPVREVYESQLRTPLTFIETFRVNAQCTDAAGGVAVDSRLFYYEIN